jgi:NAD(P)-dependent dehydrogenase (short-subunit alcohol dehydrogenase family)
MGEFDGQTAVITGGGAGIGYAIAAELAHGGARVVLISRDREHLEAAAEDLCGAGLEAIALAGDVTDPDLLSRLEGVAPEVDILVNNAAVFASYGPLEDVPLPEIDAVLAVDLRAYLILARHVLPGMKRRGFGRIVNIGSLAGSIGAGGQIAYATAKSALWGLTRSIAAECGRKGITCNLIEPGLISSERALAKIAPEIRDHLIRAAPLRRPGTVEEIAYAAAFLASRKASFITGVTLPVGGGMGLGIG